MRHYCVFLSILVLLICSPLHAAVDPYRVLTSQQDLDELMVYVKNLMASRFSMTFRKPVNAYLVDARKMDELYRGAYRGAQIGLYMSGGQVHTIYILEGKNWDMTTGTAAHELTHAWQSENCVAGQDAALREGSANWVEYKALQAIGSYMLAQNIMHHADPVYGVGFKKMLVWEDALGESGVMKKLRTAVTIND